MSFLEGAREYAEKYNAAARAMAKQLRREAAHARKLLRDSIYHKTHREAANAYHRAWLAAHPEKKYAYATAEYQRAWRAAHPGKNAEYRRRYRETHRKGGN